MFIKDNIYGEFEIEEPILIELINSKPVQRLKGIIQQVIPTRFQRFPWFTRYEHSIGVMLLLRKLGATIEEQVSGLLHDVSHTAFSHMIDMLLYNDLDENFQDKNHENIIKNSEIPKILENYNFDVNKISNPANFSLLEQPAPDLCADRVDYCLRDMYYWANPEKVNFCISNLINNEGKIIFNNKEAAKEFALSYHKCQKERWGSVDENVRCFIFVQALNEALKQNLIKFEDFYKDDNYIMKILEKSDNARIIKIFKLLEGNIKYEIEENKPEFIIKKKFRYVDPIYIENNIIYKLSKIDKDYNNLMNVENKKLEEIKVKFKDVI